MVDAGGALDGRDRAAGRSEEPQRTITCSFLWMCSGYYDYEAGYMPEFPGIERFKGRIVHPQKWTEDIDYAGKKVVVIGSGATAVTLVPAMAADGARTSPCCSARRPTSWRGRPRIRSPTSCAAACRSSSPTR